MMRAIAKVGDIVWSQWEELRHAAAVLGTTLFLSAQPRRWGRTVRRVFARQLLFSGVESVRFILVVAVLVGVLVVGPFDGLTGGLRESPTPRQVLVLVVAPGT